MRTFNVQQSYIDKDDPWTVILAAAAFAIISTISRQNGYSTGQLICFLGMILPIKHRVDRELICQQKRMQINRDNSRKKEHIVEYDYKVVDKLMLTNHTAYKYETPYKDPFFGNTVFYQWHGTDTMW